MKVVQLARAAGVSPHTVRYYIREGLLEPHRSQLNRYAQFAASDLAQLRFIRRAQRLGLTLAEIRTIRELAKLGDAACPFVRDIVQSRREAILRQVEELKFAEAFMVRALDQWKDRPEGVPSGDQVQALIDALAEETPMALDH